MILFVFVGTVALAGCSAGTNSTNNEQSAGNTPSETAAEPSSESEPAAAPQEPVAFTFLTQDTYDPQHPITSGLLVLEEFEKMANVDIEWIAAAPGDAFTTLVQTTMASNRDLPDVVMAPSLDLKNLARNHVIIPLDDLIAQHGPNITKNFLEAYPDVAKKMRATDGKLYHLGWMSRLPFGVNEYNTLIRKDWLDKAGVTKLPETIDEYYEALKAIQNADPNGNGKKDEVLVGDYSTLAQIAPFAFGLKAPLSGAPGYYLGDDGKLHSAYVEPAAKEWLAWMSKMYTEGLIDPEVIGLSWDKLVTKMTQDTAASFSYPTYLGPYFVQLMSEAGVNGAHFVPTMPFVGASGQRGVATYDYGMSWNFVITSNAENPEAIIRFVDAIFSDDGKIMMTNGIEGTDWERNPDGTIDTSKYAENVKNDPAYSAKLGVGLGSVPFIQERSLESVRESRLSLVPYGYDFEEQVALWEAMKPFEIKQFIDNIQLTDEEEAMKRALPSDLPLYMDETIKKFFMGEEPLSNWDSYVERSYELGLNQYLDYINAVYSRFSNM